MTSFRGQASWAKGTSRGGKLMALVCHPTKKVNKAEKLTYLSTNIDTLSVLYNQWQFLNHAVPLKSKAPVFSPICLCLFILQRD